MRKALLLAAAVTSLAAACSGAPGPGGPQQDVFKIAQGIQLSGAAPVPGILDLGLPTLHNVSDHTVMLRSVQLVSPPPAVHVLNVTAYLVRQVGAGWVMATFGDLPKQCPAEFKPSPVTGVVT